MFLLFTTASRLDPPLLYLKIKALWLDKNIDWNELVLASDLLASLAIRNLQTSVQIVPFGELVNIATKVCVFG